MTLKEITEKIGLDILTARDMLETEVTNGYTSDLLSDVMAHTKHGDIWITLQIHQNIVAVAKLKELSGIIVVNGRKPEEDTLKKAEEEKVPLMTTQDPAFVISGKLYRLIGPKD
ncbi:MAG: serine kinase [Candidatus Aminicenantes bacterium]|nr:serine kinase [Candidatus Aminicenantes bacterium]